MKRLVFHEWIHSLKRTHHDLYKEIMAVVRNSKFSQLHSQASAEYLENSRPLTQEEIDEGVVDTSNPAFWKHYNSLDATEQQELLGEEGLATLAEDMSEKWGLFSALNSEDTGLFDRLRDWFRRTYQGVFKQNKLYKEIYSAMESASKEPATATTEDGGPVFAARRGETDAMQTGVSRANIPIGEDSAEGDAKRLGQTEREAVEARAEAGRLSVRGRVPASFSELSSQGWATVADPPLVGLPAKIEVPGYPNHQIGPSPVARAAAAVYMERAGVPYDPPSQYIKVDKEFAARVAEWFDAVEHSPQDPVVKASYEAMIN